MPHENSSPAYNNLRDAIVALGMEISDSILSSLSDSVIICRRQNEDRREAVDPILLGIEAVGNHIDSGRALSDPKAFSLLQDLLRTYKIVTDDTLYDKKSKETAREALQQVLEWQHQCLLHAKKNLVTDQSVAKSRNLKTLLGTIQHEISETCNLIRQESAGILDIVQKQVERGRTYPKTLTGTDRTSIVTYHFDALQQTLQEELNKIRR